MNNTITVVIHMVVIVIYQALLTTIIAAFFSSLMLGWQVYFKMVCLIVSTRTSSMDGLCFLINSTLRCGHAVIYRSLWMLFHTALPLFLGLHEQLRLVYLPMFF